MKASFCWQVYFNLLSSCLLLLSLMQALDLGLKQKAKPTNHQP